MSECTALATDRDNYQIHAIQRWVNLWIVSEVIWRNIKIVLPEKGKPIKADYSFVKF